MILHDSDSDIKGVTVGAFFHVVWSFFVLNIGGSKALAPIKPHKG